MKVVGDKLPQLLRFFAKGEHAEQFVENGSVRFGVLSYYKKTEDGTRKDAAEGEGAYTARSESVTTVHMDLEGNVLGTSDAPGDVHHHINLGNPAYVCCFSDAEQADVQALRSQFGEHVVRVTDPMALADDLANEIAKLEVTHPLAGTVVDCARVDYDKGEKRETELSNDDHFRLSYSQKPADFSHECEYRLVILQRIPIARDRVDDHVTIELGKALDYAEIIDE